MELVGRVSQIETLRSVLSRKKQASQKLTVLPIYGPGGVGKSSLLQMAEGTVDYCEQRSIRIHIDGSTTVTSLQDFVERLVSAVKADARQRFGRNAVTLPETETALGALREILAEAEKEIAGGDAETIKKLIEVGLRMGKALNKISKKSKENVDFEQAEEAFDLLKPDETIRSLQTEVPNIANMLGIGAKAKNLRNALRENAARTLAEALVNDLTVLLVGYSLKDSAKPMPEKIVGCDVLTMILDDYEHLVEYAGQFIVGYLLPQLRDSRVPNAVVVVSGRDDVRDTDPSWEQHLQSNLLPGIDVGPLSESDIAKIAESENVSPHQLWTDTEGYPYFIQLWIEASKSGESALSLKRFYVRTTRWMNAQQQEWIKKCVVLDCVNLDTLTTLTGSRKDAASILEWFEGESSVRATDTDTWTVRKYIRARLRRHLEVEDPSGFAALRHKAMSSQVAA